MIQPFTLNRKPLPKFFSQGSRPGGNYPGVMAINPIPPPPGRIDWPSALEEHGRWLRVAIWSRVGDRHAVEEVLQEVALAAVSQRSPLLDPAKLPAWLHRLAVRQALLHRRGQGRRGRLLERYADRFQPTESADPLAWLLQTERATLVRTALDRLPRRDAEILMLKHAEDWTYRQLADHLGLSVPAVEARLHRARQRLRDELSRQPAFEVRP